MNTKTIIQQVYKLLLRGHEGETEKAERDFSKLNLEKRTPKDIIKVRDIVLKNVNKRLDNKLRRIAKEKGLSLKRHTPAININNIYSPIKIRHKKWLLKTLELARENEKTLDYTEEDIEKMDVGDAQVVIDRWDLWRYQIEHQEKEDKRMVFKSTTDTLDKAFEIALLKDDIHLILKNGLTKEETINRMKELFSSGLKTGLNFVQKSYCIREGGKPAKKYLTTSIIQLLRKLYGSGEKFISEKRRLNVYNLSNLEAIYALYTLQDEYYNRLLTRDEEWQLRKEEWKKKTLEEYGS